MSATPSVELDEILGFREARERAEQLSASDENLTGFVKYRVFLNQLDTFNAKYIASYLTDQVHGAFKVSIAPNDEIGGEDVMGEGMGMPEEIETERRSKPRKITGPQNKYEVVGTLEYNFHNKPEDALVVLNEDKQEEFIGEIMKCGYIIYDITKNESEIAKALATLAAIDKELEKIKEQGPKTFKMYSEVRVFILISTVMTWALTKPIDPDEPDLPFTEADYKKRKPHPNYLQHIACEREVTLKGRKYKDKLKTYIVCSGITYGGEEEDFTFLFKLAWNNESYLPIFHPGSNYIPLIHVRDLTKVIHRLCEILPEKIQYILAVEQTPCTLRQIVKSLSKAMGRGRTKDITPEEAFLYGDVTQKVFERCTVNLNMEPSFITDELEVEWQSETNLAENMAKMVMEFRMERNLIPIKIIIHGPPAVGKTRLAKKLCDYYGSHYVSIKTMIEETLADLRDNIEQEKLNAAMKEEKQKIDEEFGEDEGEGDVEEEEDANLMEWQERLKDIESALSESENGKLPDEYVVRLLKSMLASNICQNQGYVLDGYPKTLIQAKELFGQASEGGGEEEEPEDEVEDAENTILPGYIVTLQAPDDFLCKRIMSLPESELQGTHYTEEHMLRRLAEFRMVNTEDDTVLNFFDEIEIHPLIINVVDYPSEDMQEIFDKVVEQIGPYKGFGLTPEEQIELMKIEEERQKLLAEEARLTLELLEKQAVEEHKLKMEEWTKILEKLQAEEEKLLSVQCEPLRHYLMKFVFPTLSKGLIEVARIKPFDPVDFLAEYLFRENPEGHMFDPSYTRDGEQLTTDLECHVKDIIEKLINKQL